MLISTSNPRLGLFLFVQTVILILRMSDDVDAVTTALGVLKILWHLLLFVLLFWGCSECTVRAYHLTAFIGDFFFGFSLFIQSCRLITLFNEDDSELRREKPDLKLYESLFLVFMMVTMGIDIWIINSWWKGDYKEISPSPTPIDSSTPPPPSTPPPFHSPQIWGTKEEYIVCKDGIGGTIIAFRSMTSEYHGHNVIIFHHYTRQAITQNRREHPNFRVIHEREILKMHIPHHDRSQLEIFMNGLSIRQLQPHMNRHWAKKQISKSAV